MWGNEDAAYKGMTLVQCRRNSGTTHQRFVCGPETGFREKTEKEDARGVLL